MKRMPGAGKPARLFRAVYEQYGHDPIPSRSERGRFHDETTGGATSYLAASASTAWREVTYRWKANRKVYRMAEVLLKASKIVDLTDPDIQARYGVDEQLLTGDDHGPCRRLAARLRAEGFEGLWTYSKADRPNGRQMVVFCDLLGPASYVRIRKIARDWTDEE